MEINSKGVNSSLIAVQNTPGRNTISLRKVNELITTRRAGPRVKGILKCCLCFFATSAISGGTLTPSVNSISPKTKEKIFSMKATEIEWTNCQLLDSEESIRSKLFNILNELN